jgi:hypothetical protein
VALVALDFLSRKACGGFLLHGPQDRPPGLVA